MRYETLLPYPLLEQEAMVTVIEQQPYDRKHLRGKSETVNWNIIVGSQLLVYTV